MSCLWTSANPNKMGTSVGPRCVCGASHPPPACVSQRESKHAGAFKNYDTTRSTGATAAAADREIHSFFCSHKWKPNAHTSTRDLALSHTDCASTATHKHTKNAQTDTNDAHTIARAALRRRRPRPVCAAQRPLTHTLSHAARRESGGMLRWNGAHATHVRAVSAQPCDHHPHARARWRRRARRAQPWVPRRAGTFWNLDIFQTGPSSAVGFCRFDSRSSIELFVCCGFFCAFDLLTSAAGGACDTQS